MTSIQKYARRRINYYLQRMFLFSFYFFAAIETHGPLSSSYTSVRILFGVSNFFCIASTSSTSLKVITKIVFFVTSRVWQHLD